MRKRVWTISDVKEDLCYGGAQLKHDDMSLSGLALNCDTDLECVVG